MSEIDRIAAELRVGLKGVTSGPWGAGHGWVFTDPASGSPREPLRNILRDVPEAEIQANCDYIAAAQPENIRLLLDELSRRSEVIERAKVLERIGKMMANAAYNIHQRAAGIHVGFGLDDAIRSIKSVQEEWDRALSSMKESGVE